MSKVQTSQGEIFYIKKGNSSTACPIILLHGGPGGSHLTLEPLIKPLSKKRIVYAYDQMGGGRSSELKSSKIHISHFVQELDELTKIWGLEKFHLYGASWGTTLALEYYLRKGKKKVASLIFQSPMFDAERWEKDGKRLIKDLSKEDQKIIRYCHEVGATDSKVYQQVMERYYLKHVLRNKKASRELDSKSHLKNPQGKQIYQKMWGSSEFFPTGSLKNYDQVHRLKEIQVPSLFICGQFDEATPQSTQLFSSKVKGAQFEVVSGASHVIAHEQAVKLTKVIDRFIEAR